MKIPRMNQNEVPIPKEHNFHIDEGQYRARIHKVIRTARQNSRGSVEYLRIMFEVLNVPGKDNFLNLAKAEFKLNMEHGSDLRNVIGRIVGREGMAALSGKTFDFDKLMDMEAEVEISHIITDKSENYDFPFVIVSDVQRPGTMKLPEPKPQPEPKPVKETETDDSKEVSCY
jgi:hypothetical protein